MRHSTTIKGGPIPEDLRSRIAARIRRVARRLRRLPHDGVHLHAVVEHRNDEGPWRVSLALRLPSRTLAAHEEGGDPVVVLGEAFDELERALGKEKTRVLARRRWAEAGRGAPERWLASRPEVAPSELSVIDQLEKHLPDVARYVRRELRLLEAAGELVPHELDARDIVDAAFARALEKLPKKPERLGAREFLLGFASRVLHGEVDRLRSERRRAVRVEEEVPQTPPEEEVSTLGGEILEFYQPDEDLRMEDILPALGIGQPDRVELVFELERLVSEALAGLPPAWREAFALQRLEGLSAEQAAEATGRSPAQLEADLERAGAYLQERLAAAGFAA